MTSLSNLAHSLWDDLKKSERSFVARVYRNGGRARFVGSQLRMVQNLERMELVRITGEFLLTPGYRYSTAPVSLTPAGHVVCHHHAREVKTA